MDGCRECRCRNDASQRDRSKKSFHVTSPFRGLSAPQPGLKRTPLCCCAAADEMWRGRRWTTGQMQNRLFSCDEQSRMKNIVRAFFRRRTNDLRSAR
jgi:hypothetical protein